MTEQKETETKEFKETPKTFFKKLLRLQIKRWHRIPYVSRFNAKPQNQLVLNIIQKKAVLENTWVFDSDLPLPKQVKYLDHNFNIEHKQIFRQFKFNPFETLYRKITKLKTRFELFYFVDDQNKINPVELKDTGKINGYTLFVATHATVYKRALGELIQSKLGDKGKYIIYAVVAVVIIVIVVLIYPSLTGGSSIIPPVGSPTPTPLPTPMRLP